MKPLYTLAEVLQATGGRPLGVVGGDFGSVSIDSREIAPGALFVAIKGDVHDGHDFVLRALEQGAAAALVAKSRAPALPEPRLIAVADPLEALSDLGRAARARSAARIVAVTGSAGKTTTKEAIRTVLADAGPTHASIRSFNNHWGVPLMLARLPLEAHFGVFEIGMNHAGEITPLTRMVRPHVAVITTVAAAHLEFFNSVAGIARAKAEIFLGLEPGGTAILNADHEHIDLLRSLAVEAGVGRIVTYGAADDADWRIAEVIDLLGDGTRVHVIRNGKSIDLRLQVEGRHMAANAVAALAVADEFHVRTDAAVASLRAFEAPEGRGMTLLLGDPAKPLLLLDQSYNANSASMAAAMAVYAGREPPAGNKVLVLGDMLELGAAGPRLHAALADAVIATGANRIFLVGRDMAALAEALGGRVTAYASTIGDVEDTILQSLAYGDAVMVKGSKGVQLAGLVQKIRARFA